MKPIIRVEKLSKRYRIGARQESYATLRDALSGALRAPLRRLWHGGSSGGEMVWALKDIGFEVRPGEIVGVIGRNGAGKSTLLKILSRITEPTEGRAELYGRVGSLLEVGTGFHPELSGRDNVYLNGSIMGMKRSEIERKFDEIAAFSEIEKFLDTPVKRYSSGMYTRLAFAVAAHLEPEILLVDEVLAVGDAAFQKKCLGKMGDIARKGRTVLFVSHNLSSIAVLCNRALYLSSGHLIEDGPAAKVVESYITKAIGGSPSVKWDSLESAPGTEMMHLRSVHVLDGIGQVSGSFRMDDPIHIEVTYCLHQPGLETNVGYHLYNSKGILIFVSADFHDAEWRDIPKEAGCYRSTCKIPGQFLNAGSYTLDVSISRASGQSAEVFEKEVVTFELIDEGPSEVRGRFMGEWQIGALRPKLKWKTTRLRENARWD
ncbi:MAG: lipopolysaccharide transport system ATP-binding protein [Acidobacteriota bacterium]|jgi:lipopolysaccharide transport system ATP-binding protein|nr:lipopolysaccharide transport system ATP-binding protein [Acidobacteriota bacterium]